MANIATYPNRIGSLVFCPHCGNLLDVPGDDDQLKCEQCGHVEDARAYEQIAITTKSHPSAFPSTLRQKKDLVKPPALDADEAAGVAQKAHRDMIEETCPDCGNEKMIYWTQQLRSADEGSTVFYQCPECGHMHTTNN